MSKVTTKSNVRLSYTNLLTPRAQNEGDDPTFSTAILIPKSDTETLDAIKAGIASALDEGLPKVFGGKKPNGLRNPLRDGDADRPDDENYAGMMFINAKGPRGGKEAPVLLGPDSQETTSPSHIYSGVEARVALQFYAYDKNGNKGIACGVSSVLSTGKGEPLANVVTADSAREDFGVTTPASEAKSEFKDSAPAASANPSDAVAEPASDDDIWAK
jgi:hypothetical protein